MGSRLKLHEELCEILETRNVYYNPPASIIMNYPCIRYSMSNIDRKYANNKAYMNTNRYEVTVIDVDPDSDIYEKILDHFQMCSFDRAYISDNLNHFTLTLYY